MSGDSTVRTRGAPGTMLVDRTGRVRGADGLKHVIHQLRAEPIWPCACISTTPGLIPLSH